MATGTKRQRNGAGRQGGGSGGSSAGRSGGRQGRLGMTIATESGIEGKNGRELVGSKKNGEEMARGLGWFSIGLGLAEVVTPRGIAKIVGVRGDSSNRLLIRLLGLREIAHGVAILSQNGRSAATVWSRVFGDAVDLACLGAAFASPDTSKGRLAFATANVLTVTALDVVCSRQLSLSNPAGDAATSNRVNKSIVINSSPEELYQFWRDFENLPRFMHHLESVKVSGDGRSHWVANAPAGTTVEWDAEITEDRPNELIAWRSLEGADVYNRGSVRFERAPGGRGTIVHVEIDYDPPGGKLGVAVAKLFGEEPELQVHSDLRRFKQVIETGEVVLSEGTIHGTGATEQRPAQPAANGDGR
ncbi:MAG: SRPBCC family protein [Acidobacteria bacterium]|nr:SRPBCC family protein [Acidobacteriota bacterium]